MSTSQNVDIITLLPGQAVIQVLGGVRRATSGEKPTGIVTIEAIVGSSVQVADSGSQVPLTTGQWEAVVTGGLVAGARYYVDQITPGNLSTSQGVSFVGTAISSIVLSCFPALQFLGSGVDRSSGNSTVNSLGANASFIGATESILGYQEVTVSFSGAPAIAPGTYTFEFSHDGITWPITKSFTLAGPNKVPDPLRVVAPYFRVRYVNGSTILTSLQITTLYHKTVSGKLTRYLDQQLDTNEPVHVTRSVLAGLRPDGNWGNAPVSKDNYPRMSLDAIGLGVADNILNSDRTIFGAAIIDQRISQVSAQFNLAIAANPVTAIMAGTGTVTQANAQALVTTGIGVTSSARLETNRTLIYSPARECYGVFTRHFTSPTSTNSEQRHGLFDDSNGFYIGYHGLIFGVTVRNSGTDIFTDRSIWNGDLLDGNATSLFTRLGIPEAINFTFENVFRIRFGWLGSAQIIFQVMSPDLRWVTFHTILQPNTSATASIQNPNLPMRMEVIKTLADATSLQGASGSWDLGIVGSAPGTSDISNVDLTGTFTSSGLTSAIDASRIGSLDFTIVGSAVSGVLPTLDLKVQVSEDGLTWFDLYMLERITATTTIRVPAFSLGARYYRWVYTIGGTTPSFTFTIKTTLKVQVAPARVNLVDYGGLNFTVNGNVSPARNLESCRQVCAAVTRGALGSNGSFAIQASLDGSNWDTITSNITVNPSTTGIGNAADSTGDQMPSRYYRVIVQSGGSLAAPAADVRWFGKG